MGLPHTMAPRLKGSATIRRSQVLRTMRRRTDTAAGTTGNPTGASFAMPRVGRTPEAAYGSTPAVPLHPAAIAPTGSGLPHNNMQPYLVLNYIIATQGIFPPRP